MKTLLTIVVLLGFTLSLNSQQRVARSRPHNTVYWHKKVVTGVDSLYSAATSTANLYGASDSVYSEVFENRGGDFSATVVIDGGTTKSYYIDILGANKGFLGATAVPDSHFVPIYSLDLDAPQFVDSMAVATVSTEIDTNGSFFVLIPPLKADLLKFFMRTSATHTGTINNRTYLSR